MSDSKWKTALWNLTDTLLFRRITARVALSAGLIGLAAQAAPGDVIRVPVSPALEPEATVRKFKGRYVLKRVANTMTVHLAGHRSHSSHSSHASHSSHSSSSHYSGAHSSHFSSSAPPPSPSPIPSPQPALPRSVAPQSVPERSKPLPIFREDFSGSDAVAARWRIGVLATAPETFDPKIAIEQHRGLLTITPAAQTVGLHFSGYVSTQSFDLNGVSIAVQIREAARGTSTIFAAAVDAANWAGFRIEGGQLVIESHNKGRVAAKRIPYDAAQHRFLRLRTSNVAPVIVWETSADGRSWNPEYVETTDLDRSALRIVLSAGTTKRSAAGPASFGSVVVEGKP